MLARVFVCANQSTNKHSLGTSSLAATELYIYSPPASCSKYLLLSRPITIKYYRVSIVRPYTKIHLQFMAPKGDNVVVSNMKLERLLSMKGGKGEASYANNSQAQVSFRVLFAWFPPSWSLYIFISLRSEYYRPAISDYYGLTLSLGKKMHFSGD